MDEQRLDAGAPPEATGPGPQQHARVLRRSTDDRMVFGVAGGLGRYFDVDPVIIRIAFVLLALFGGSGLLLYLIGVIAIPEQGPTDATGEGSARRGPASPDVAVAIGAALIVIGSLNLAGRFFPLLGDLLGPVLLLTAGALVIVLGGRR